MRNILILIIFIAASSSSYANNEYITSIKKSHNDLQLVKSFGHIKVFYFNKSEEDGHSLLFLQWFDPVDSDKALTIIPIQELNKKFRFNVYKTSIINGKPTIFLIVGNLEGEELGDAEIEANYSNPGEYTLIKHY